MGDVAGRHAFRPGLNEKPEDIEPGILRKRGENGDRVLLFHISKITEICDRVKSHFNDC
jgi:hypothetical protein